jgi:hypothetical protein
MQALAMALNVESSFAFRGHCSKCLLANGISFVVNTPILARVRLDGKRQTINDKR